MRLGYGALGFLLMVILFLGVIGFLYAIGWIHL